MENKYEWAEVPVKKLAKDSKRKNRSGRTRMEKTVGEFSSSVYVRKCDFGARGRTRFRTRMNLISKL